MEGRFLGFWMNQKKETPHFINLIQILNALSPKPKKTSFREKGRSLFS